MGLPALCCYHLNATLTVLRFNSHNWCDLFFKKNSIMKEWECHIYAMLGALDAILGHRSAHSFATGPVTVEPEGITATTKWHWRVGIIRFPYLSFHPCCLQSHLHYLKVSMKLKFKKKFITRKTYNKNNIVMQFNNLLVQKQLYTSYWNTFNLVYDAKLPSKYNIVPSFLRYGFLCLTITAGITTNIRIRI